MKRSFLLILFVMVLMAMPFQVGLAADNGNGNGNNGNRNGWTKGVGNPHGVPDPASTLALLAVGMSALGAYSIAEKRKRDS